MATQDPAPAATPQAPARDVAHAYSPGAALLSYLVPGLGQIVQGRVGKGLLFFFCLYGLFFYGMYLGDWENVYVPAGQPAVAEGDAGPRERLLDSVLNRARFAGQFWIGIAAWPAIIQYNPFWPTVRLPNGTITRQVWVVDPEGKQRPMVVEELPDHPWFGKFMREPNEEEINRQTRDSGRGPDLGWMYTVIAGVLNILVIYDAFAGPAFGASSRAAAGKEGDAAAATREGAGA